MTDARWLFRFDQIDRAQESVGGDWDRVRGLLGGKGANLGDMVRVGGLHYTIDPNAAIGKRLSDLELHGKPLDANKKYRVAGWASVREQPPGTQIWDLVADYLRDKKTVQIKEINLPKVKGMSDNPGYAAT